MSKLYDVVVLGAGPAGLAAGLYAGRSRLSTVIVEKGKDGGQIAITDEIENYPGQTVEGESGPSLIARMTEQAAKFGCDRVAATVEKVVLEGDVKKVITSKGEEICGKTIILATVLTQDRLDVKERKNSSVEVFLTVLHAMLTSSKTLKFS